MLCTHCSNACMYVCAFFKCVCTILFFHAHQCMYGSIGVYFFKISIFIIKNIISEPLSPSMACSMTSLSSQCLAIFIHAHVSRSTTCSQMGEWQLEDCIINAHCRYTLTCNVTVTFFSTIHCTNSQSMCYVNAQYIGRL